jgi:hypothetical protein
MTTKLVKNDEFQSVLLNKDEIAKWILSLQRRKFNMNYE